MPEAENASAAETATTTHARARGPEFRTIDGSGNNLENPNFNATGAGLARIGEPHFVDGISDPRTGPNPRTISNVVVGEGDPLAEGDLGLSGMMYAWGQFIDHDLDLLKTDGMNNIDVVVPDGDPLFPDGSVIPITRAVVESGTGTDTPAVAANAVTGWLDASMVYGSDAATAADLRLPDGHLKTSAGDNLPIVNGAFAAGDIRAAENPALTSLQTLFVREHNWQVDRLHEEHPNWSGDRLYDYARAIVAGEIQNITYSEFLPRVLGPDAIGPYHGYDPSVDPRITEEFAGAAFRFGHSIVSPDSTKRAEDGTLLDEQELRDVFFTPPQDFAANGGADAQLRHLANEGIVRMDVRIVDDLRNFLFDPPVAMDLAAINIERGRDLGLGRLNETREALGLQPYTDFSQVTDDQGTVNALRQVFGNVDNVDLWTGGLAEASRDEALVGETFKTIIEHQFEALRDGDRLWFENQGFDAETLTTIKSTTLGDIIDRATDTRDIQDDVFAFSERHTSDVAPADPDAPQLVIGRDGRDRLVGGALDDILVAGSGRQVMSGGSGADEFRFHEAATQARITDFTPDQDTLGFDAFANGGLNFQDVRIGENQQGDAVVRVGDDRVVLVGVHPDQLAEQNFEFHQA